jgi:hypothetical protein
VGNLLPLLLELPEVVSTKFEATRAARAVAIGAQLPMIKLVSTKAAAVLAGRVLLKMNGSVHKLGRIVFLPRCIKLEARQPSILDNLPR